MKLKSLLVGAMLTSSLIVSGCTNESDSESLNDDDLSKQEETQLTETQQLGYDYYEKYGKVSNEDLFSEIDNNANSENDSKEFMNGYCLALYENGEKAMIYEGYPIKDCESAEILLLCEYIIRPESKYKLNDKIKCAKESLNRKIMVEENRVPASECDIGKIVDDEAHYTIYEGQIRTGDGYYNVTTGEIRYEFKISKVENEKLSDEQAMEIARMYANKEGWGEDVYITETGGTRGNYDVLNMVVTLSGIEPICHLSVDLYTGELTMTAYDEIGRPVSEGLNYWD